MSGPRDICPIATLRITDAKTGKTTRMIVGYSQALIGAVCNSMVAREMTRDELLDGMLVFATCPPDKETPGS